MRDGALLRETDGRCLLPRVWKTEGSWERARGLLGRKPLGRDEALLIEPCWLVHTFGMRYALDLAFVDGKGRVSKLAYDVRPGRISGSPGARQTFEFPAGVLAGLQLQVGDRVIWQESRS